MSLACWLAPAVAGAGFERANGWLVSTAAGWRVAFSEADGWHTEVVGPAGAGWLGLPVASGSVNQPPESVTPTAAGAELLGASWVALLQGRTTAVNRGLGTGASDPGHLTLLAGPSGDFFGGYRLDGWGVLWRLGGMNPNPEVAVDSSTSPRPHLLLGK